VSVRALELKCVCLQFHEEKFPIQHKNSFARFVTVFFNCGFALNGPFSTLGAVRYEIKEICEIN
jgi:hypothetical protein